AAPARWLRARDVRGRGSRRHDAARQRQALAHFPYRCAKSLNGGRDKLAEPRRGAQRHVDLLIGDPMKLLSLSSSPFARKALVSACELGLQAQIEIVPIDT